MKCHVSTLILNLFNAFPLKNTSYLCIISWILWFCWIIICALISINFLLSTDAFLLLFLELSSFVLMLWHALNILTSLDLLKKQSLKVWSLLSICACSRNGRIEEEFSYDWNVTRFMKFNFLFCIIMISIKFNILTRVIHLALFSIYFQS